MSPITIHCPGVPLVLSAPVAKQLFGVPADVRDKLRAKLEAIAAAPAERHAGVVALQGQAGVFRVRQGDWRAVFSIVDGDVVVDRVAHRREVYR